MMAQALDIVIAVFIVLGAGFALLGSLALVRFSGFFNRVHGPSVVATLGLGGVLIASLLYFAFAANKPSVAEVLIALAILFTVPVSAQLLMSAALKRRAGARPPLPEK